MARTPRCPQCGSTNTKTSTNYKIKKGLGYVGEFLIGYGAGSLLGDSAEAVLDDIDINLHDKATAEYECCDCGFSWKEGDEYEIINDENSFLERLILLLYHYTSAEEIELHHFLGKHLRLSERDIVSLKSDIEGEFDLHLPEGTIHRNMTVQDLAYCIQQIQSSPVVPERASARPDANAEREYLELYKEYASDNEISERDRKMLDRFRIRLGISEGRAKELEASCSATGLTDDEQEYLNMYKEYAADGEISERDRKMLDKFRTRLGISGERARELEASCSKPQLNEDELEYLALYKEYAADGEISERDRKMLNKMRDRMGISEERAKEIEQY